MYVVPTPFHLVNNVAHRRTLILPADVPVPKYFVHVGNLTRVETKELVVAYSFDLRSNELAPTKVLNPDAGKEHRFYAWRLKGDAADKVSLRPIAPEELDVAAEEASC